MYLTLFRDKIIFRLLIIKLLSLFHLLIISYVHIISNAANINIVAKQCT